MPVHSVELGHFVLLNVEVQETGERSEQNSLFSDWQISVYSPSEFAIINTDGQSDFEIEDRLTLKDPRNRELHLNLNYTWAEFFAKWYFLNSAFSRYPESGGAFKVQIYCPYIFINKSDLAFSIKAIRATRTGVQEVAGDIRPGITPSFPEWSYINFYLFSDELSRPFPFCESGINLLKPIWTTIH